MSDIAIPSLTPLTDDDLHKTGLPSMMQMSPALAIFFNDAIYGRCKQIATLMSQADGVMPAHLLGKPAACFAVVSRSIVWKMDPWAVAMSTYQTPGGAIGFEGKLVAAILENSGKIDGGVKYELFGDWSRIRGKFKWETSPKGKRYAVAGWNESKDEEGLGVKVSAHVRGEVEPRSEEFFLSSFWPRNSTLWALRPDQQIKYASARAFANTAMPGIFLGVAFDVDPTGFYGEPMTDITPQTPRPKVGSPFERSQEEPKTATGEPQGQQEGQQAVDAHQADEATEDGAPAGAVEAEGATEKAAEPKGTEEVVMDRGKRLLKSLGATNDVADLRLSIQDELEAGELDGPGLLAVLREWNGACDARSKEIATPPASKPKGKGK